MSTVDLSEVNRRAELLTRTDRKYIVSAAQLDELIVEFAADCSVLEIDGRRCFSYSSTYHDTPDRALHRATAHRRPKRFKVRVREYTESGLSMFEVKSKSARGRTVKHRIDVSDFTAPPASPHDPLNDEMRAYVDSVVDTPLTPSLEPVVRIDFRRTTLLIDAGESRCTIDRDLTAENSQGAKVAPDVIVIETKSASGASSVDRWLWSQHVRPTRLSKYCTSMAALDATLPANRWHRQLNAHF